MNENEQLRQILYELNLTANNRPSPPPGHSELLKNITTIAVALTTAGVIWLTAGVAELKTSIAVLAEKQERREEVIKSLEEFSKEKRFTERDFENRFEPERRALADAIDRNSQSLNTRADWMVQIDRRMNGIENNYNIISQTLKNIEEQLKKKQ